MARQAKVTRNTNETQISVALNIDGSGQSSVDTGIGFNRDQTALGFEITVRDAPDGKVFVKLVPHAKYREPHQLLPTEGGERDQGTESFPAAGVEVALSPTEYLVIGTDSYREGTFGHAALTGPIVRGDVNTVAAHLADIAAHAPATLPSYVALARATADRAVLDGRLLPIRRARIIALLDAAEAAAVVSGERG